MKTMIDHKFDMSLINENQKVIMLSVKKNISTHEIEETKMLLKEISQVMEWGKTFNVMLLAEEIKEHYPDFDIMDFFVSHYIESLEQAI